jgi:anti-anti-sigma factor
VATTGTARPAPAAHKGLLRSRADPDAAETAIGSWLRSATDRGQRICTVGGLSLPEVTERATTALTPQDLHPSTDPARLVQRALADGFRGLGVLIHADEVIASTSARFHAAVETALTELCVEHPVDVLCVYDRPGVGIDCLALAVPHHGGDLREHQLTVSGTAEAVHIGGEVDMTNVDVFAAALRDLAVARGGRLRIDLSRTTFLSAGAAYLLHRHVAALRTGGAHVEVHGVAPHVARALRLVELHRRSSG